jgi:hypothetical protein
MTSQIRSARFRGLGWLSRETNEQTPTAQGLNQLIPVALALYLTPVLLIVLVVGGIGMLVLAVVRTFTALARRPDIWPRTSGQTRSPLH